MRRSGCKIRTSLRGSQLGQQHSGDRSNLHTTELCHFDDRRNLLKSKVKNPDTTFWRRCALRRCWCYVSRSQANWPPRVCRRLVLSPPAQSHKSAYTKKLNSKQPKFQLSVITPDDGVCWCRNGLVHRGGLPPMLVLSYASASSLHAAVWFLTNGVLCS